MFPLKRGLRVGDLGIICICIWISAQFIVLFFPVKLVSYRLSQYYFQLYLLGLWRKPHISLSWPQVINDLLADQLQPLSWRKCSLGGRCQHAGLGDGPSPTPPRHPPRSKRQSSLGGTLGCSVCGGVCFEGKKEQRFQSSIRKAASWDRQETAKRCHLAGRHWIHKLRLEGGNSKCSRRKPALEGAEGNALGRSCQMLNVFNICFLKRAYFKMPNQKFLVKNIL